MCGRNSGTKFPRTQAVNIWCPGRFPLLVEHDLVPKTGIHFSGSCSEIEAASCGRGMRPIVVQNVVEMQRQSVAEGTTLIDVNQGTSIDGKRNTRDEIRLVGGQ